MTWIIAKKEEIPEGSDLAKFLKVIDEADPEDLDADEELCRRMVWLKRRKVSSPEEAEENRRAYEELLKERKKIMNRICKKEVFKINE